MIKTLSPVFLLVFLSACISIGGTVNNGLVVTTSANPPAPFTNSFVDVSIDMENTDVKSLHNMEARIFDTGILSGSCPLFKETEFLSGQFKTYTCTLGTPSEKDVAQDRTETQVSTAITFNAELGSVQLIELISETEFNAHQRSVAQKPSQYSYGDKNLLVEVSFNEPLPIIVRPNKRDFMTITIRNIGNGFVGDLKPGDVSIEPVLPYQPWTGNSRIYECSTDGPNAQTLRAIDKTFPRITCELQLPPDIRFIENYGARITINYMYEVRATQIVTIVR